MKTIEQLTYVVTNEQGVLIDKIKTSGTIRQARNIARKTWGGWIKISCNESGEQLISRK